MSEMLLETAEKPLAGVVGFFDEPGKLLQATRAVRESKYSSFDVFTPYPVHGLDAAQGLKRSKIPFVTLVAGLTGSALAFGFEYWTSAVDWKLNIGGKPFNSWPAFVPVMFEVTVLLAGISTFIAMLLFNRLPNVKRRSFDNSITRDRFALFIDSPENEEEALRFLKSVGATDVRSVAAEGWF